MKSAFQTQCIFIIIIILLTAFHTAEQLLSVMFRGIRNAEQKLQMFSFLQR